MTDVVSSLPPICGKSLCISASWDSHDRRVKFVASDLREEPLH
jgi:hypothetical protein